MKELISILLISISGLLGIVNNDPSISQTSKDQSVKVAAEAIKSVSEMLKQNSFNPQEPAVSSDKLGGSGMIGASPLPSYVEVSGGATLSTEMVRNLPEEVVSPEGHVSVKPEGFFAMERGYTTIGSYRISNNMEEDVKISELTIRIEGKFMTYMNQDTIGAQVVVTGQSNYEKLKGFFELQRDASFVLSSLSKSAAGNGEDFVIMIRGTLLRSLIADIQSPTTLVDCKMVGQITGNVYTCSPKNVVGQNIYLRR